MIYLARSLEAIPQTSQLTTTALCFTGGIGLLAGNIFGKIILDQERTTSRKIFPAVIIITAAGVSALMIGGLIGLVTTAAFFALGFRARFNTTEQTSAKNTSGEESSETLKQLKQATLDLEQLEKDKQGLLGQLQKTTSALEEANQEKDAALRNVKQLTKRSEAALKVEKQLRDENAHALASIKSHQQELKKANLENKKATPTVSSLHDKIAEQTNVILGLRVDLQVSKDKVDNLNRDCKALDKMLSEEAEKTGGMTTGMNDFFIKDYPKLNDRARAAEAKVDELETKIAELQAELIKAQSPA